MLIDSIINKNNRPTNPWLENEHQDFQVNPDAGSPAENLLGFVEAPVIRILWFIHDTALGIRHLTILVAVLLMSQ